MLRLIFYIKQVYTIQKLCYQKLCFRNGKITCLAHLEIKILHNQILNE